MSGCFYFIGFAGDFMEFVIGFVLIAIMMLFIGFGLSDIALLVIGIICVGVIMTAGFFVMSIVLLAVSRRVTAQFSRFDEESRFPVAVYKIGDEELPNMFPREMVMRDKLYVPDKDVYVMYCRLRRAVFDKNAIITIVSGSAIFIPMAAFVVFVALRFFHIFT